MPSGCRREGNGNYLGDGERKKNTVHGTVEKEKKKKINASANFNVSLVLPFVFVQELGEL